MMNKDNIFSTETRDSFDKPYVKVFFLDDSIAVNAKTIIESLNCIKSCNITESKSKEHTGQTLTVYPKPMVNVNNCEKEIIETLNQFFSNIIVGDMHAQNDVRFSQIEKQILKYLDEANATIDVCVAWFTNTKLRNKLLEKKKDGVEIRVIIFNDGVNHSKGVDLTGLKHKEYRGERGGIMHENFV